MQFSIRGLGLAIPEHSVSQEVAAEHAVEMWGNSIGRSQAVRTLFRQAGVRRRHSVLLEGPATADGIDQSFYQAATDSADRGPTTRERMERYDQQAVRLASRACKNAIQNAQIEHSAITHLVTVSCSGFSAPGVDLQLIESLELDPQVSRTHIGFMGCHGAFNGLRVAKAYAESDPRNCVLLCCVELCSLHQQYSSNPQQIVANALFSDGSAALVGTATQDTDTWRLASQRSKVLPSTGDMMGWKIGDNGFCMSLGPQVPDTIQQHLRPWLSEWLQSEGLTIEQIQTWAVHPGGPRILTACTEALDLPDTALSVSRQILAENGNMSSPTILFILDALRSQVAPLPAVALAFGPGLTIEAALWK